MKVWSFCVVVWGSDFFVKDIVVRSGEMGIEIGMDVM